MSGFVIYGLHQRRRGVQTQRDKWEEVGETTGEREKGGVRERDTEATSVEALGERGRVDREIGGGSEAGILKAAVTPVTSHLSNPAPT